MITSIVPEGHPLNNPTQATKERRVGVERRHRHPLHNPAQATKERNVGMDDGTDILSITPHKRRRSAVGRNDGTDTLSRRGNRHPRCKKPARREMEALEKSIA